MVRVKIYSPVYDEEAGASRLDWRVTVKADGAEYEIDGDRDIVANGELPVIDAVSGKQLLASDAPEAWARNLPHAFRAGDLVVSIDADDTGTPAAPTEPDEPQTPPRIPALPDAELSTRSWAGAAGTC
jgi:hypothetical protein